MSRTSLAGEIDSTSGTARPHAAIIFGSAATERCGKPASVRATCEAIGLPRSTYYYQSHRSTAAIELEQKIVLRLHELRERHPNDGYRRMTQLLQQEGFQVNRKRIARLMQLHSLTSRSARPTVQSAFCGQSRATVTNLSQSTHATGPRQVWVADIAYAHIGSSLIYAAGIIDVWSREVVGYAASLQISSRLPSIALHAAVRAHRPAPGCVHHSNCGTQYRMRGYCELLQQYGLIPSLGEPLDPAMSASNYVGSPPPRHVVELRKYETWEDVIGNADDFIHSLYSQERLDQILGER